MEKKNKEKVSLTSNIDEVLKSMEKHITSTPNIDEVLKSMEKQITSTPNIDEVLKSMEEQITSTPTQEFKGGYNSLFDETEYFKYFPTQLEQTEKPSSEIKDAIENTKNSEIYYLSLPIKIESHIEFLNYIKDKYSKKKWTSDISGEKIKKVLNNFGNIAGRTTEFYKKIIKFAPLLISDTTSKTKKEIAKKIGIAQDSSIIKDVLSYLNPRFTKITDNRLNKVELEKRAKEMNLKLLPDYEKDYKNAKSILQWECKECNCKFPDSFRNVDKYKHPCPYCRKRKRQPSEGKYPENIRKEIKNRILKEIEKFKSGFEPKAIAHIYQDFKKDFPPIDIVEETMRQYALKVSNILDKKTSKIVDYYELIWKLYRIPKEVELRTIQMVQAEIKKFRRGFQPKTMTNIYNDLKKEFPQISFSMRSIYKNAKKASKIDDINYYELIWKHPELPEDVITRVTELIREEIEKYKRGEIYVSFPKIRERILNEIPEGISITSIGKIAKNVGKVPDTTIGEITDYYDLMWGISSKKTYEDAMEIARVRGLQRSGVEGRVVMPREDFENLAENQPPTTIKVTWNCNVTGHSDWDAIFASIIAGRWCRKCFYEKISQDYDDLVELARKRGIEENNIAGSFVTPRTKFEALIENSPPDITLLDWNCNKNEHKNWKATPSTIKRGSWCLYCREGKYQRKYRINLEKIFGIPFLTIPLSSLGELELGRLNHGKFHLDCQANLPVVNDELILGKKGIKLILNNNGLLPLLNANEQSLIYPRPEKVYRINNYSVRDEILGEIIRDFFSKKILVNENDPILIEFPYGFLEFDFKDDRVRLISKVLKDVNNVLDLSSGELKFASEYNGPQHYYFPNQYNKIYNNDFDKTFASFLHFLRGRCNDLSRKEITNRNNTVLTEFPYWVDEYMNNSQTIQSYIIEEFYKKTGIRIQIN